MFLPFIMSSFILGTLIGHYFNNKPVSPADALLYGCVLYFLLVAQYLLGRWEQRGQ